jgi:GAF domain-containing protein
LRMFQELGLESVMIVPLVAGGRTLGAMSLVSADAGRRYAVADLAFAEDLAGRCALAIENARLYREAQEATRAKEESLALLDTLLASAPVGLGFLDRELRYVPQVQGVVAVRGDFLLRRGSSLYRHGDIRYDDSSGKTCRGAASWRLRFIKSVR